MTPLRSAFAPLLLVVCVLLATGCAGDSGERNVTPVSSVPIQTKEVTYYDDVAFKNPVTAWQANLTYPWTKVAYNILVFIDPGYPVFTHGMTREQTKQMYIEFRQAIPADEAIKRFNLTNTKDRSIGDHVFLIIYVYPNTSTYILDPYVTVMSGRYEKWHAVDAWVDVNNLERLASLDGVQHLEFVEYAEHS